MSSVQSLPNAATWNRSENGVPTIRGTDNHERLNAVPDVDPVLLGGDGDHLIGEKEENIFRFEHPSYTTTTLFDFNPKAEEIDVADLLKNYNITAIHIQDKYPKNVGDVQFSYDTSGVSTLTIKVSDEGPDFVLHVDNFKLLPQHVNFFNQG
ncbi:M10 family metallopeptidase C-terminal domain-containing protein [Pseudomonas sp. HN11]|uniref:M10 family metallopeptidase C-terminal domain-containing protein n=1 Tax=Pseudomonas sp. HN11 TaxID=1344094 RepID=UPI001F27E39E|nr:M10 family metallopeptidase C-terminal domain-containing protein [Pseudomonas sp. HN11]UII69027.1 M10 family metallopeptidase C-terminal domain-containing protein [Pseudomonas sp. HN11]